MPAQPSLVYKPRRKRYQWSLGGRSEPEGVQWRRSNRPLLNSDRLSVEHARHRSVTSVYIRRYPDRTHGRGRWRKIKGIATVRLADGTICEAEIHWFEAHGIGRKDFKVKRVMR